MTGEKKYFYSDGTEQFGPFSLEELLEADIERDTPVWHFGLKAWKKAAELPELQEKFRFQPPPLEERSDLEKASRQEEESGEEKGQSQEKRPDRPPKTWLVESVLATIFCCLPVGIVGIVHASQVESHFYSGNYVAAKNASRAAGRWTKVAFFIGLALLILYFLLIFTSGESNLEYRNF